MDALTTDKAHREFAEEAFNQCWELMNLPQRSAAQTRQMIRLAEASFWHWQESPERTAQNDAIGYWQLARVYALAGEVSTAISYALRGVDTVQSNSLSPFYTGYAWESAARAYALAGMSGKAAEALNKARAAAARVKDPADKAALEMDLITIQPLGETVRSANA